MGSAVPMRAATACSAWRRLQGCLDRRGSSPPQTASGLRRDASSRTNIEGAQHFEPESSRRGKSSGAGRIGLSTSQPAHAVTAVALYTLAVAALTMLLALRTSGYALPVIAGLLSLGLTVPFIVLGQQPDAPEATTRVSFPVLGTAPSAEDPGGRTTTHRTARRHSNGTRRENRRRKPIRRTEVPHEAPKGSKDPAVV